MTKKIFFDLTGLCDRHWTGVEQFGITFSKILSQNFHHLDITNIILNSINDTRQIQDSQCFSLGKNKGRLITEYLLIPFFIWYYRPEYIVFPIFPPSRICWLLKSKKTKIITVIHDVVPWHYQNTLSFKASILLIPRYKMALKKSYNIITVSQTEKEALQKLNYNAVIKGVYNPILDNILMGNTSIITRLSLEKNKYILSVSTIEPRKNFHYMLEILYEFLMSREDLKIVLSGRTGWKNSEIAEIINRLGDKIIYTGYISNNDLSTLYKNALFYITLPIHEGFGRTPLESLLNGTPAVVSDIPVFRELLQSGVIFLPLDNMNMALEILRKNKIHLLKIETGYYQRFQEGNYHKLIPDNLFE
jgi:glycosyltransferase involved in cell wall biosynthesis